MTFVCLVCHPPLLYRALPFVAMAEILGTHSISPGQVYRAFFSLCMCESRFEPTTLGGRIVGLGLAFLLMLGAMALWVLVGKCCQWSEGGSHDGQFSQATKVVSAQVVTMMQ